ncbi:MAG: hypothetical protein V1799_07375 [bacterium]
MGKIKKWAIVPVIVLGFMIVYWVREVQHNREVSSLRAERIAADSLHKVGVNQWERKVREVESERELWNQLKEKQKVLYAELGKRDISIKQFQELVVKLRNDSGHGIVYMVDSSRQNYRFELFSDNGIVRVSGLLETHPLSVSGLFTFNPLPPISVVLYEDELKYIDARIIVDERYMSLVSFNVQRLKPSNDIPSWKTYLGAGIAKSFGGSIQFGPLLVGGVAYKDWGVGGVVCPDNYGVAITKFF